jgi:hypothetical protein
LKTLETSHLEKKDKKAIWEIFYLKKNCFGKKQHFEKNFIFFSGETMHHSTDSEDKYIWWFNTYPLEFAEFLLVTALTRGVWLHPLAANDVGYMDNKIISEEFAEAAGTKQPTMCQNIMNFFSCSSPR